MNQNKIEAKFLQALCKAQKESPDSINEILKNLEVEFGKEILHELVNKYYNWGWTGNSSKMGCQGYICIQIKPPILSLEGIDYVEKINAPLWKKISIKKLIKSIIWFILIYLITMVLPNLNKIDQNYKIYIKPLFHSGIGVKIND